MLRLTTKDNKLILLNDYGASLEFELFDKKIFRVIERNINDLKKAVHINDNLSWKNEECKLTIEKKSNQRTYLVLSATTYHTTTKESREKFIKIVIPESVAYEISSRMILLNKTLKMPNKNN